MSAPKSTEVDVLIVGGGLVGASLACALGHSPLRVALIESTPLASGQQPSYDDRPLALSFGSRRILEGVGVWGALEAHATPIRNIHVSDRGHFGVTRIKARDHGVDALGYVTEARTVGTALWDALEGSGAVDIWCPAQLEGIELGDDGAQVEVKQAAGTQTLTARLLVVADGGRSPARELLQVGVRERDYGQVAVTANVTPQRSHENTAYERFTDTGPLALLPLSENRCGVVWTVDHAQAASLIAQEDTLFLAALGNRFGGRLGKFVKVGRRGRYPLALIQSREQVRERLVIVGNAAHTLHPIAGQGLNLGLRDVAALAETVVDAVRAGEDPGSLDTLRRYAGSRRDDQRSVTLFTDGLVMLFSNRVKPFVLGRNLGLLAMDLMPGAKRGLARRAMGLAGRQPRIARGLAL